MPSETSDNHPSQPKTSTSTTTPRQPKTLTVTSAAAAAADPLPCPRCNSTNTKFCYYNNYSMAQPRHFCKSCRRYWTQGGAFRNVPIGGGTRKSSSFKSHRASYSSSAVNDSSGSTSHSPPSSTSAAITSSALSTLTHEPEPLTVPEISKVEELSVACGNGGNLSSGSMLTMNPELNRLYMGLGGYGSGCGYGYTFYEPGLGVLSTAVGKGGVLPYHAMGMGNYYNLVGGGVGSTSIGEAPNTWRLLGEVGGGAGDGVGAGATGVVAAAGLADGEGSSDDSFARPGSLAISTPGDASAK